MQGSDRVFGFRDGLWLCDCANLHAKASSRVSSDWLWTELKAGQMSALCFAVWWGYSLVGGSCYEGLVEFLISQLLISLTFQHHHHHLDRFGDPIMSIPDSVA